MINDPVNPNHYRNSNNRQIIDMIRWFPFSLGNTMKYIYRYGSKGKPIEDLNKALWYFEDYVNNSSHIVENDETMIRELFTEIYNIDNFRKKSTELLLEFYYGGDFETANLFITMVQEELKDLES